MKKLTETQKEIIDLLADGWEMGKSLAYDGGFWIQKGGVGYGGESKKVKSSTAVALIRSGHIKLTESKFPTARYNIK